MLLLKRIFATFLDYMLVSFFLIILLMIFGIQNADGTHSIKGPIIFVPVAFALFYFITFEYFFAATIGHLILRLRIISDNGSRITLKQAFLRRMLDPIELILSFGIIAFIVSLTNSEQKRLGDLIAKTKVIEV